MVHAGYSRHREALLRAGIELYELDAKLESEAAASPDARSESYKASLHAKSFVLDRERVFIGSLNLDPRSVLENTEIGTVIESPDMAEFMAEWFDRNVGSIAFQVELVRGESGTISLRWTSRKGDEPLVFDKDPYTGAAERYLIGILRLLPIDSQL